MKKVLSVVVLVMAVTVGLGACSSDTPRATPADRLAFYEAHAGDPVRSFRLFGRLNGWTPLGNSAMVVWTRPSEAWLLNFTGPCQDLQFATAIADHQGVLDQFQKALASKDESFITLPNKIPVRLLYHTAFWDGRQVQFRPDIYGWDTNVARALKLEPGPVIRQKQPESGDIGP